MPDRFDEVAAEHVVIENSGAGQRRVWLRVGGERGFAPLDVAPSHVELAAADAREALASLLREEAALARAEEREACAKVCERMVIGGRAWTHEQAVAADALFAAAEAIRRWAGEP